ncbi:MAG: Crp/Fnr family transcriptional regulator [Bacteroidales bacterium]|nr:Crp/Fnr family transcriptional regulator [Bacteroidales bacterium]MCF8389039.1 Crp/Fnr family transcriptional regulator [Bacteroidales bacterium]MCF8397328.1 Crp/Fnr family transcriptional regulator [Bacteroidales bacterium]
MRTKCMNCQIKSTAVKALSVTELEFLEENCYEIMYRKGEMIIEKGKHSTHIAYIKSGLVKIHMEGPRNDQVLKIAPKETYVGIQSILSDQVHQYSATALQDCLICHIDVRSFRQLVKKNSGFANELIIYLCEDELNYFKRFVSQSQKQINGRLADTLLYFATDVFNQDVYELPLSRKDLGTFLCTTRESATRSIRELCDLGALRVNKNRFEIRNRTLLQTISKTG